MTLRPTHILAFDGTDQAECRGADDEDHYTSDPRYVTCEACLQCIDDQPSTRIVFPLNPGD